MIIITQLILIFVAMVLVVVALGGRRTHAGRAWKKIGLVILAIGMVIAVIFPQLTNDLARLFGVGRGADLLLYALTSAFIIYVLNVYLHRQEERDTVYRLARKIAIIDANERYQVNVKK